MGTLMRPAATDQNGETSLRTTDSDTPGVSLVGDSRSTAEVLKELRHAFPDMPLADRVAALATLSRT